MESDVFDLVKAGIAVELLVPTASPEVSDVGVRLRTFGKLLPKNKMVLGSGPTFYEALCDAMDKAKRGRWEGLDWAARPWPVNDRRDLNIAGSWGLV